MREKEIEKTIFDWVFAHTENLSKWSQKIWNLAEPAWREYQSAKFFIKILK